MPTIGKFQQKPRHRVVTNPYGFDDLREGSVLVYIPPVAGGRIDDQKVLQLLGGAANGGMADVRNADAQSEEWLLTRTAVHEAGHLIVAQRWGYEGRISLGRDSRIGNGHCQLRPLSSAPAQALTQIALAGNVASIRAVNGGATTHKRLMAAVREHPLSEGDAALLPASVSELEVVTVWNRLDAEWANVIAVARTQLQKELAYYSASTK
jgi:hypothetical protein